MVIERKVTPTVVKLAFSLLALALCAEVLIHFIEPGFVLETWSPKFVITTKIIIALGTSYVIWMILLGYKWARFTYLILFLVYVAFSVPRYPSFYQEFPTVTVIWLITDFMIALSLVMLHFRTAQTFYDKDIYWPITSIGNKLYKHIGILPIKSPEAPSNALIIPFILLIFVAVIIEIFGGTLTARLLRPVTQANLYFMMGFGVVFLISAAGLLARQPWARTLCLFAPPVLAVWYAGYFYFHAAYTDIPKSALSNIILIGVLYGIYILPLARLKPWLKPNNLATEVNE